MPVTQTRPSREIRFVPVTIEEYAVAEAMALLLPNLQMMGRLRTGQPLGAEKLQAILLAKGFDPQQLIESTKQILPTS